MNPRTIDGESPFDGIDFAAWREAVEADIAASKGDPPSDEDDDT